MPLVVVNAKLFIRQSYGELNTFQGTRCKTQPLQDVLALIFSYKQPDRPISNNTRNQKLRISLKRPVKKLTPQLPAPLDDRHAST